MDTAIAIIQVTLNIILAVVLVFWFLNNESRKPKTKEKSVFLEDDRTVIAILHHNQGSEHMWIELYRDINYLSGPQVLKIGEIAKQWSLELWDAKTKTKRS